MENVKSATEKFRKFYDDTKETRIYDFKAGVLVGYAEANMAKEKNDVKYSNVYNILHILTALCIIGLSVTYMYMLWSKG